MGRPKRLYPLGKYRLRIPKEYDKNKAYPIELEYTWNRQIIRKTTNVFVKEAGWNLNGNQGGGEIRTSYGSEYKRLNQLLLARVERIESQLAEYNEKHPNQILFLLFLVSSMALAQQVTYNEGLLHRTKKFHL